MWECPQSRLKQALWSQRGSFQLFLSIRGAPTPSLHRGQKLSASPGLCELKLDVRRLRWVKKGKLLLMQLRFLVSQGKRGETYNCTSNKWSSHSRTLRRNCVTSGRLEKEGADVQRAARFVRQHKASSQRNV